MLPKDPLKAARGMSKYLTGKILKKCIFKLRIKSSLLVTFRKSCKKYLMVIESFKSSETDFFQLKHT